MSWDGVSGGREVTPAHVLAGREERAARQRAMLAKGGRCLISFSLNIAGPIKQFPLARYGFQEGLQALTALLPPPLEQKVRHLDTGSEALLLLDMDPEHAKRAAMSLEEGHALGRLFDADVLDSRGAGLSRTGLGAPPRRCLICGGDAKACGRSRAHPLEQVQGETVRLLREYRMDRLADCATSCAVRALLYEVSATPKPGLVDRNNAGSHRDMDFFTFLDSSAALIPWFRQSFCLGYRFHALNEAGLFAKLRFAGRQAEKAMFSATGGVNTHKGAVFSLGLVCGALGAALAERTEPVDQKDLLERCARLAKEHRGGTEETTGTRLYRKYGVPGARGEACGGFPSAAEIGLPALRRGLSQGMSLNDAALLALTALLAGVEDTNMIHRSDVEQARRCREQAARLLPELTPENITGALEELDRAYISSNLSPGGCADLLILSLMLHFCAQAGLLTQERL